jgi:FkbM family methyltransferase
MTDYFNFVNSKKFIIFIGAATSRLPRIKGIGFIVAMIASFFMGRSTIDVEVSVFGKKMLLNPSDLIGNYLIFSPQWFDFRERRLINKILSNGDYVVDVGANIGAYTLIFADLVGPSGMVTAIEAEHSNALRLKHNIDLNGLMWVNVINYGASDKEETLNLLLNSTGNAGGHSFYEQSDVKEPPVQEVRCQPLANLLERDKIPKLMKLDIEGFEYRVLRKYFDDMPDSKWPEYILLEDVPSRREGDAVSLALDRGYKIIKRYDYNVFMGRSVG